MLTREKAILNFLDEIAPLNMHGFMLTLGDAVLAEGSWAPFALHEPHRLYSVSKSLVSAAIGMLSHDGLIDLDAPIVQYFPQYVDENTPPLLREVTIRNMLSMATCYDRAQYSPLDSTDWTRPFFFGQPTHVPGTVFSYDTSASQVMASLVEQITGEDVLSFLGHRFFPTTGMTDAKDWLKDRSGNTQGGTGLIMTLHDFNRFAKFWMSDGMGLVDPSYIKAATTKQIDTKERSGPEERYGYGYQLWMMREGFSMYGLAGQMAMCLPEQKLILCTTADLMLDSTGVQPLYDAFFRCLSGVGELPTSEQDAMLLQQRLASLRCKPLTGPDRSADLSITLQNHTLPFHALMIHDCNVQLTLPNETICLNAKSGCWTSNTFLGVPCYATAAWSDNEHFQMHLELTGNWAANVDFYVVLTDHRAVVRVVSSIWELAKGWSGQDWGNLSDSPSF